MRLTSLEPSSVVLQSPDPRPHPIRADQKTAVLISRRGVHVSERERRDPVLIAYTRISYNYKYFLCL